MSTRITTGDENLLRAMKEQLNTQMTEAAEPLLQAALKDMEKAMRKRLATALVAYIDSSFSMERMGNELLIRIRREP